MTEEQAINVFFQARGELRAFINIYFLAIAALLGWLFIHRGLPWYFRCFLAVAFILLAAINWIGIWYSFLIIEAAQLELEEIGAPLNPEIVDVIKWLPFSSSWFLAAHTVVDLLMLVLIFLDPILGWRLRLRLR